MQPHARISYVLLVDDDVDDRYEFSESFSKINWSDNIKIFESGESMLAYLDRLPDSQFYPTLIVLDYLMPKLSGEEVLKLLKQNDQYKHIPVIIYSSQVSDALKEKLLSLGAKYCYKKVGSSSAAVQFARALKQFSEQSLSLSNESESVKSE